MVSYDSSAERRTRKDEIVVDVGEMQIDLATDTARRKQKLSCVRTRCKSITYACKGAKLLLKEDAIQAVFLVHALCFMFVAFVNITKVEWCLLIISFSVHLSVESVNSAIEAICDFVHPEFHASIGAIKDIGAAAVLFTVICVIVVDAIILWPHINELFH